MREIVAELKAMHLYGMAGAWEEIAKQEAAGIQTSRWLIEHLLEAEQTDRAMRSIRYQLHTAKFPVHRDLAGHLETASKHLSYGEKNAFARVQADRVGRYLVLWRTGRDSRRAFGLCVVL